MKLPITEKKRPTAKLYLHERERSRIQDLGAFGLKLIESLGIARISNPQAAISSMLRFALAHVTEVSVETLAVNVVEVVYLPDDTALPEAGRFEKLPDHRIILLS